MAKNDWYFLGFILTFIVACLVWGLAIVVYRANKKNYLNKTLALSMVFMGFWMASGFMERILPTPNNNFTLWTFRLAYASGIMTPIFFFLFALGLYLGHAPSKKVYYPVMFTGIIFAALSFSPYVVKSVDFQNGIPKSQNGPLFLLASAVVLLPSIGVVYLISKKWYNSSGIDRARTSCILCGILIFFPIAAVCIFILPPILGNDASVGYAFLAGVIPVVFTHYAIIRYRLLDLRIILRRTGVLIIGTVILSLPIVILFLIFKAAHLNPSVEKALILLVFVVLVALTPAVRRYVERLSSKLFFTELYDELQLLDTVSHRIASQNDLKSGILSAISEIVSPLGLQSLGVVIPPGIINMNSWHFICTTKDDGSLSKENDSNYTYTEWLNSTEGTVITEELQRWPKGAMDRQLAESLAAEDLSACIPIKVASENTGYYLVGEKVTNGALSSTDISLLEKSAERLGIFIDNYALSAQLRAQLEELERVYLDLHDAYRFKSDIIEVTSHEFRTPVTLIYGFAKTLLDKWDHLEEAEKTSCLEDITEACDRLIRLTEQFFDVSKLQEGNIPVRKRPINFSEIFQTLLSSLSPEEQERLTNEVEPHLYMVSDPEHLQAILKNLLDNALQFSPAGKPVVLRAWGNGNNSFIQIQDYGQGIPPEVHEKIFEPFVRLESVNHHSKGIGLGLYMVRLLSSRLGIETEIDCSNGDGTTVTLTISRH